MHDFRKKKLIEHKMCVLIFSTTFAGNISHCNRATYYHKYTVTHVNYSPFLSYFTKTRVFPKDFRKILKHHIVWKSVQWESVELSRAYGQTYATKLVVSFRSFAKAPTERELRQ